MLLILDLDETLIHATHQKLSLEPDFTVFGYYVYKRPFLNEFIQLCSNEFDLAIWSSGSDDYVLEIIRQIIPQTITLNFVWGRSRCTPQRQFQYGDYYSDGNQYEFTKQFKKLKRRGINLEQTLIIDDTPAKVANSYGNAIYIREYTGQVEDNELTKLGQYLLTIKNCKNVRHLEKRGWENSLSYT